MLQGKKFGLNEEVIAKAEAYFENKDKSFYKKKPKVGTIQKSYGPVNSVAVYVSGWRLFE